MPTWKRLAVSGSDISQFNNNSGYLTSATEANGFATASFNGVELLADGSNGNLTFASSSGQGLTISANSGTDTLTFGLSSIPNTSLDNSTISGVSLGSNLFDLTVDNATLELNVGTTYNGGTAKSINVKDGGIDTNAIATSLGTLGVNSFTGSFSGSFIGTTDLPDLTDGNGINDFTYDGSTTATISVQADGTTLAVGVNGVKVADSGITSTQLNTSVAGVGLAGGGGTSLSVDLTELTLGSGLDAGNATTLNLDLTEVIATDGANRVLTSDGDGTLTAEPNFVFDGSTLTVTGNETITGNLTVQGTASFQHTEELQIADRFILMASGSLTPGDGGIVVQQSTQNVGEVFAFDSLTTRWGLTGSFNASETAYTPDAFMAAISTGAFSSDATIQSGIDTRYSAKGNIFIGDDQGIWIYS